jgi:hypothetical protein
MQSKSRRTKRALDAGESAAFSSIFLAASFSYSQAESTPAHTQVTQAVGQPHLKNHAFNDRRLEIKAKTVFH